MLKTPHPPPGGFPGMWSKSYYSNTYLGSRGEGSHAANLSGLLLDLFLRSRELVVEQSRSSWKKKTLTTLGSCFSAPNPIMGGLEVASPDGDHSP